MYTIILFSKQQTLIEVFQPAAVVFIYLLNLKPMIFIKLMDLESNSFEILKKQPIGLSSIYVTDKSQTLMRIF